MQPWRPVAVVLLVSFVHIARREISRTQFLRGELTPDIDIDAMAASDTKGTLCRAHHGAQALLRRIDQMDARHERRIESRHSVNVVGALGTA